MPSAVLFGAVLGGMAHALDLADGAGPARLDVPRRSGLIGITVGALVQVSTMRRMASESVAILLVVTATVLLSIAAGGCWPCA